MENLRALVHFLPDLQQPDFNAGTWVWPEKAGQTIQGFPYTIPGATVDALVDAAYQNGWVRSDFKWMDWVPSDEARLLRDDESAITVASPDQLAKLLTVCIRQDRFSEGALLASFESGLMLRIVLRAKALLDEAEATWV